MSPLTQPSRLFLRKTWAPMDSDAAAYIAAVETADGQALEETTKRAIDNFVLGCKDDGIWDALKASCILAGARTLSGALVPLKGTAPTNNNFVSGDYDRKTGLVGDGTTKYLDSNRNNNADPQNSQHLVAFVSLTSGIGAYIGAGTASTGASHIGHNSTLNEQFFRSRTSTISTLSNAAARTGFVGINRSLSSSYIIRSAQQNTTTGTGSQTPVDNTIYVFARGNTGNITTFSPARLAFYSIGESLDLARLDGRVSDLITAISRAF